LLSTFQGIFALYSYPQKQDTKQDYEGILILVIIGVMTSFKKILKQHWKNQRSNYWFTLFFLVLGSVFHAHNTLRHHYEFSSNKLLFVQESLHFQRLFIPSIKEYYPDKTAYFESVSVVFSETSPPLSEAVSWLNFLNEARQSKTLKPSIQETVQSAYTSLNSALIRYDIENKRYEKFTQKPWVKLITFYKHYPQLPTFDSSQLDRSHFLIVP
jgi:hypothetical protein